MANCSKEKVVETICRKNKEGVANCSKNMEKDRKRLYFGEMFCSCGKKNLISLGNILGRAAATAAGGGGCTAAAAAVPVAPTAATAGRRGRRGRRGRGGSGGGSGFI